MNYSSAFSFSRSSTLAGVFIVFGVAVVLLCSSDTVEWTELSKWARSGTPGSGIRSDDLSCVSRSQQAGYRKTKPPSSKLLERWRNYTRLHERCSPSAGNWSQILNVTGSSDECKYLIYLEPGAGLGNRLLSLVSALLYALVTDRVLLLDPRQELAKLLCEPFTASSWLLPTDFPFETIDHAPDLGQATTKHFQEVQIVHLKLFHVQSGSDKFFFCDEAQEALDRVKALAWNSNQYYVTSFFKVPSLWKKLVTLFPDRLDVFSQLVQLAIFPENTVWSLISRYYSSYLAFSRELVGVQIRPHGRPNLAEYDPAVYQVVLSCFTGDHVLPGDGVEFMRKDEAQVAVLVASLQGKYYESLRDAFLRNVSLKLVNFQTLSHEGAEFHDLRQSTLALAEMWLLSFSDRILTSGYSTFGYVAHGAASMRPWVMNIRGTSLEKNSVSCYLSNSTEPCTHFPQVPSCEMNLTTEHSRWIHKHIQECQDQPGGIQVLN